MSLPNRFDSTETGAPVLNNVTASLLAVLRACLKDGFNIKGITGITVTSEVATVQCPTHGYACGYAQLVRITGASVPALDGDKQPTLVDANYFSFPAPGVADGSYTATDARRAPLGWVEAHTGANVAIFARTAPEATASMLRVDHSRAAPGSVTSASVMMVESATDVDTYTNGVPVNTTFRNWSTGDNTATAKPWSIVGCDRGFYYFGPNASLGSYPGQHPYWFGDPDLWMPGDAYGCMLCGHTSTNMSTTPSALFVAPGNYVASAVTENGMIFQRSLDGLSVGNPARIAGPGTYGFTGPDPLLGHVAITGPYHVMVSTQVRAVMPGLWAPQALRPFAGGDIIEPDGSGRKLLVISNNAGPSGINRQLIDLTGPWYVGG